MSSPEGMAQRGVRARPTDVAAAEIETPRLFLRRLGPADLGALATLFSDRRVTRYLAIGHPEDAVAARRFAQAFIVRSREEFRAAGAGAMAVQPRGGIAAIGYCGLRPLPDQAHVYELLYALEPRYWGNGIATEAARAVVDWGFAVLPMDQVVALADPLNTASRRVMEKLGMDYDGRTTRYYGSVLALYRLSRITGEAAI